jgi:hypothetical protein
MGLQGRWGRDWSGGNWPNSVIEQLNAEGRLLHIKIGIGSLEKV